MTAQNLFHGGTGQEAGPDGPVLWERGNLGFGVKLLQAVVAKRVGELHIELLVHVAGHLMPIPTIVPDLIAVHTDRQQAAELSLR